MTLETRNFLKQMIFECSKVRRIESACIKHTQTNESANSTTQLKVGNTYQLGVEPGARLGLPVKRAGAHWAQTSLSGAQWDFLARGWLTKCGLEMLIVTLRKPGTNEIKLDNTDKVQTNPP